MRLVLTSDTHGFHRGWGLYDRAVPLGDVFVHAGDFSRDYGSWTDVLRFARWMGDLPHRNKVLCPGNHDMGIADRWDEAVALFADHGVHVVGAEPVIDIDGISFGGGPWMPRSGWDPPWAFEMSSTDRGRLWEAVPPVDVLVTHTPPAGVRDQMSNGTPLGCELLRYHVRNRIRPRLHVFGHVHEQRGVTTEDKTVFINASCNSRGTYVRDDALGVTHMSMSIRDPLVFDLDRPEMED